MNFLRAIHRKARVPGATLTETLVALSLISIVFTIGMLMWLQLNGYRAPDRLQRYRMSAGAMLTEPEVTGDLQEVEAEREGVKFFRRITPLNAARGLYEIRIECTDPSGKPILERSKIIHIYESQGLHTD